MMTLREELRKVNREYQEYFKWKFPDVRYDQTKEHKTEEEFLKSVGRKTLNSFLEWEKTPEYANLVALYLQTKIMDDIYEIYEVVREKALTGDDKAVKLLLQLNKEINGIVRANAEIRKQQEEEDEDDELII